MPPAMTRSDMAYSCTQAASSASPRAQATVRSWSTASHAKAAAPLSTFGTAVRLKGDLIHRVDLTHELRSSYDPHQEQAEVA